MTDTTQAAPAATPKATGLISRVFAKGFAALSVAERKEVLADATITAGITDAIGKAHEAMAGEVEQIEDLWDGGPAQPAPTKRARENMAGDSIPTGSGQSASGGGAEKMVREYSDVAPQNAVMTATERLGNAITLKAMRELAKAVEGINTRLDLLTTATGGVFDELAAVKAEVAKAARAAVVKSEDEEADEEARDEEDKEMSAKSRVKLAKARVAKAEITRAIKQARAIFAYGSESITNQGFWMGYAEMFSKYDWFQTYLDRLAAVTPAEVQRVAREYFRPQSRVVGTYIPTGVGGSNHG